MGEISQQVRSAQARERQATVPVDAAQSEMQSAIAVALAHAAKSLDAIRTQAAKESAHILDERDRQIRHLTEQSQEIKVAAMNRVGHRYRPGSRTRDTARRRVAKHFRASPRRS